MTPDAHTSHDNNMTYHTKQHSKLEMTNIALLFYADQTVSQFE